MPLRQPPFLCCRLANDVVLCIRIERLQHLDFGQQPTFASIAADYHVHPLGIFVVEVSVPLSITCLQLVPSLGRRQTDEFCERIEATWPVGEAQGTAV